MLAAAVVALAAISIDADATPAPPVVAGPATLSASCDGQNAEVEQASDPRREYVYVVWMGCGGIALARSADGGRSFGAAAEIGGSDRGWDPAVAVAPDGAVYVAFMRADGGRTYPVVAASFDHGATFPQQTALAPPATGDWADRDFVAAGRNGSVYVTYGYGPSAAAVTSTSGDYNVVVQRSTDRGRTFGPVHHLEPDFPAGGGDSAPVLVEPDGRVDVLYQSYGVSDPTTFALTPAHEYFTSSADGGVTWSPPVPVGAADGTMSLSEWWIDGSLGVDAAGNLYATWDTQGANADGSPYDVGWLSWSRNHGRTWSRPIRATADASNVPHVMEVAGGGAGRAYLATLTDTDPRGYGVYLRTFSLARRRLSRPVQVTGDFGAPTVWPGDTFGLSAVGGALVVSWGSAVSSDSPAEIIADRIPDPLLRGRR